MSLTNGSPLSHTLALGREPGMPCVIGTCTVTEVIGFGERLRVDGTDATVEIIARYIHLR
ncbi:PEP-utilizing enzyme [Haloechinothrix aidingensis]|uniref:PEP-utilizing enzyme n=1 Tax=Haloechinothrix aidingensis TaxID=2752311 RepID=UPI003CCDA951